jgi:hypothetical protein
MASTATLSKAVSRFILGVATAIPRSRGAGFGFFSFRFFSFFSRFFFGLFSLRGLAAALPAADFGLLFFFPMPSIARRLLTGSEIPLNVLRPIRQADDHGRSDRGEETFATLLLIVNFENQKETTEQQGQQRHNQERCIHAGPGLLAVDATAATN